MRMGKTETALWKLWGQQITVEWKQIKHMYVHIGQPDGEIWVSAPFGMSNQRIRVFLEEKQGWILKKQEEIQKRTKEAAETKAEQAVRKKQARQLLEEAVPPLLKKWQPFLGVQAKEWRLRDMKTRWGSCNVREKRIWLNLQLANKAPECLEYVVVHELCHLLVPNHSKAFWNHVERALPDWRERRKKLNWEG